MDLVSIPCQSGADDVVTGTLKTRDGVSLRYARWHPPPGRKGTVCIFQGRAEFIEKYFETVRELRSRGFAVATFDWRGQGRSERACPIRARATSATFREYERDVEALHEGGRAAGLPAADLRDRHSMGGTVMMRIARQGSRWFDRIVLSAPMISCGPAQRALGAISRPRCATGHGLGL
jgi:lysophospholipase